MSQTDTGRIVTERQGHILIITFDRPAKYNGFTPEMGEQLARAYTLLETDPDLWIGVVRAEGRHFTAGLDLPRWAPSMASGQPMWPTDLIDPFDLREPRRTKPVLVAVKGITFTLGIELMLAADIVVAADDCRFSQLEVKRGLLATGGATLRMAERAGKGNALLLLLTGDEFDAPTALRLGFVQKVVPAGTEFDEVMAIARRIEAVAPLAVREVIRSVRLADESGPLAAAAEFQSRQKFLSGTDDFREGVQSFVERRPAAFQGR